MKTLIKLFLLIAILHIFFAGCNSKDSSSSDSSEDELETAIVTTDNAATTAPVIAEVTAVTTPTNDTTPDYTFSSDEAGTITYGGSCFSSTTSAINGNNTITFNALSNGTYSKCTITVTDSTGNVSNTLEITSFTIDTSLRVFVVVGASGTIVKSTDNGSSWNNVTSPTTNILSGVGFSE